MITLLMQIQKLGNQEPHVTLESNIREVNEIETDKVNKKVGSLNQ
jgi:hypothetical protein